MRTYGNYYLRHISRRSENTLWLVRLNTGRVRYLLSIGAEVVTINRAEFSGMIFNEDGEVRPKGKAISRSYPGTRTYKAGGMKQHQY